MTRVGQGRFMFAPVPGWEQLPAGWKFVEAVGVATDSRDRVFVFNRGEHPLIVFDRDGKFLQAWGEGQFVRPHGIWIGGDDAVYLTDDLDHTVRKYTPDGRLLWKLGTSGRGSDTGVRESDYRTITRGGPPFNQPTNLAIGAGWIALHFRWLRECPHPQVLFRRQAAALLGRAGRRAGAIQPSARNRRRFQWPGPGGRS